MKDSIHVYNPLHRNKGVGRRTGKVIQKKRNIKNGADNFEDYLTSDDDKTLNETEASILRTSKNLLDGSKHSKEKQAVLDLQSLSHSKENVTHQVQRPGLSLKGREVPEDRKVTTLLTRNSKIGRRTGRVIEKKKNINNGVDNFEDYISSDGDMSLDVTDASSVQSQENNGPVPSHTSKKMKHKGENSPAHMNSKKGGNSLPQQPESSTEVSQDLKVAHLMTRNSRFGRRTGKDLLAGKKLADLNNFSSYLSDLNDTNPLLPSPPQPSSRRSKSADSRPNKASHTSTESKDVDAMIEKSNTPLQDANKDNFMRTSSDEEDPLGGLTHTPRSSLKANRCDPRSSMKKRRSLNETKNSSSSDRVSKSNTPNISTSQRKRRSEVKSSLAVLAIKNSAKQKSLLKIATDVEDNENLPQTERGAAEKTLSSETDQQLGQHVTTFSELETGSVKPNDIKDSKTENLMVSERLRPSRHEKVDESIYFRKSFENSANRKSWLETERETECLADQGLSQTSRPSKKQTGQSNLSASLHADEAARFDEENGGLNQNFVMDDKTVQSTAPLRGKNVKRESAILADADNIVILSKGNLNESNSSSAKSTDAISEPQSDIKNTDVRTVSSNTKQNHEPADKNDSIKKISKVCKNPTRNTNLAFDCEAVPMPESENILRDSESDLEVCRALDAVTGNNPKSKSKDASRVRNKGMKKRAGKKQTPTANSSSYVDVPSTELMSEANNVEEHPGHLLQQAPENEKMNEEPNNGLHFISVSSKVIPYSSKVTETISSSNASFQNKVLKKSAKRMLDLSQGEDSDRTSSGAEEAIKPARNENESICVKKQRSSKLKSDQSVQSKKIEDLRSRLNLSTSGDKNEEQPVFMSITSKKPISDIPQKEPVIDDNQSLKQKKSKGNARKKKVSTDEVLNNKEKNTKTVSSTCSHVFEDGVRNKKARKRKSSEDVNVSRNQSYHGIDNENMTPKPVETNLKKKKKNLTPQAESHDDESADLVSSIASKPFVLRELMDTPKTGDRQRFRNYRKKIFTTCIPEEYDLTKYKRDISTKDEQREETKIKKVQSRNPRTVLKKSKSQKLKEQRKAKDNRQKVIVKKRQVKNPMRNPDEELKVDEVDEPKENHPLKALEPVSDGCNREGSLSPGRKPLDEAHNLTPNHIQDQEAVSQIEVAVTYTGKLKSVSGKKRGRPRKLSQVHGKADEVADFEASMCSPVSLRLIDSLPSVTPQSGVSFRKIRKQSLVLDKCRVSKDLGNDVELDESLTEKLKSVPGKKRGRPRQSSEVFENEKISQPEEADVEYGTDGNESTCTPVSLKLINALPNITPQSGVSFRQPKSHSIVHDDNIASPDPYTFTLQRHKRPETDSTPCGRTIKQANGLTSCLRDSSVPRPFKKGRRVRISNFVISQAIEKTGDSLSNYYTENSLNANPSKTQVCAFHLNNHQANTKLKITWNDQPLKYDEHPVYLGVTLDRTLSFSQHAMNVKAKVAARNSLLRKLANSNWGADPKTLRTTALALSYSTSKYSSAVWARSCHAKKVDAGLNNACRIVTGQLRPTQLPLLYRTAGIASPDILRQTHGSTEKHKQETDLRHPLFDHSYPSARLKTRKSFRTVERVQPDQAASHCLEL
ncbi:RNA-directed DNA polymerase from mobile element jockey-like protein [Elysia marginata]|uniref:RNA-directed DNA polymerase from mobile element jockey-like protein n=1 Tax=Elysia marginata TaxID=1093978 RepID=A0AAV4I274_9GAST|nr:RNA-directed DNA polymerase from mobile element jockey-like protein [Elysia marginata]